MKVNRAVNVTTCYRHDGQYYDVFSNVITKEQYACHRDKPQNYYTTETAIQYAPPEKECCTKCCHKLRTKRNFSKRKLVPLFRAQFSSRNFVPMSEKMSRGSPQKCLPPKNQKSISYNLMKQSMKPKYNRSRSITTASIRAESIKAFKKKKVVRVYLPEKDDRGVGSKLIFELNKRRKKVFPLKITSKCVGDSIPRMVEIEMDKPKKKSSNKLRSAVTSPILLDVNTPPEKKKTIKLRNAKTSPISNDEKRPLIQKEKCVENVIKTIDLETMTYPDTTEKSVGVRKSSNKLTRSKGNVGINKSTNVSEEFVANKNRADVKEMKKSSDVAFKLREEICKDLEKQSSGSLECVKYPQRKEEKLPSNYLMQIINYNEKPLKIADSREIKLNNLMNNLVSTKTESSENAKVKQRFKALRKSKHKEQEKLNYNVTTNIHAYNDIAKNKKYESFASPESLEKVKTNAEVINKPHENMYKTYVYKKEPSSVKSPAARSSSDNNVKSHKKKDSLLQNHKSKVAEKTNTKAKLKLWERVLSPSPENKKPNIPVANTELKKPSNMNVEPGSLASTVRKGCETFLKKIFMQKKSAPKPKTNSELINNDFTTHRCEVNNGFTFRIEAKDPKADYNSEPPSFFGRKREKEKQKEDENCQGDEERVKDKPWLDKFITDLKDTQEDVHIRWNNRTYDKNSSCTITEIIHNVSSYDEESDSTIRSSELTSKRRIPKDDDVVVLFFQNIQAYMVQTRTLHDQQVIKKNNSDINKIGENSPQLQKITKDWSKGMHQVELVLHSRNFLKLENACSSSQYLKLAPTHFSSESQSESLSMIPSVVVPYNTSDEEVYQIVEYETQDYNSSMNRVKKSKDKVTADDELNVAEKLSDSSGFLDAVVNRLKHQDGKTFMSKAFDVGLISQRPCRDGKKYASRISPPLSDEKDCWKSQSSVGKRIAFANSYLKEYYRKSMDCHAYSHSRSVANVIFTTSMATSKDFIYPKGYSSCPGLKEADGNENVMKSSLPDVETDKDQSDSWNSNDKSDDSESSPYDIERVINLDIGIGETSMFPDVETKSVEAAYCTVKKVGTDRSSHFRSHCECSKDSNPTMVYHDSDVKERSNQPSHQPLRLEVTKEVQAKEVSEPQRKPTKKSQSAHTVDNPKDTQTKGREPSKDCECRRLKRRKIEGVGECGEGNYMSKLQDTADDCERAASFLKWQKEQQKREAKAAKKRLKLQQKLAEKAAKGAKAAKRAAAKACAAKACAARTAARKACAAKTEAARVCGSTVKKPSNSCICKGKDQKDKCRCINNPPSPCGSSVTKTSVQTNVSPNTSISITTSQESDPLLLSILDESICSCKKPLNYTRVVKCQYDERDCSCRKPQKCKCTRPVKCDLCSCVCKKPQKCECARSTKCDSCTCTCKKPVCTKPCQMMPYECRCAKIKPIQSFRLCKCLEETTKGNDDNSSSTSLCKTSQRKSEKRSEKRQKTRKSSINQAEDPTQSEYVYSGDKITCVVQSCQTVCHNVNEPCASVKSGKSCRSRKFQNYCKSKKQKSCQQSFRSCNKCQQSFSTCNRCAQDPCKQTLACCKCKRKNNCNCIQDTCKKTQCSLKLASCMNVCDCGQQTCVYYKVPKCKCCTSMNPSFICMENLLTNSGDLQDNITKKSGDITNNLMKNSEDVKNKLFEPCFQIQNNKCTNTMIISQNTTQQMSSVLKENEYLRTESEKCIRNLSRCTEPMFTWTPFTINKLEDSGHSEYEILETSNTRVDKTLKNQGEPSKPAITLLHYTVDNYTVDKKYNEYCRNANVTKDHSECECKCRCPSKVWKEIIERLKPPKCPCVGPQFERSTQLEKSYRSIAGRPAKSLQPCDSDKSFIKNERENKRCVKNFLLSLSPEKHNTQTQFEEYCCCSSSDEEIKTKRKMNAITSYKKPRPSIRESTYKHDQLNKNENNVCTYRQYHTPFEKCTQFDNQVPTISVCTSDNYDAVINTFSSYDNAKSFDQNCLFQQHIKLDEKGINAQDFVVGVETPYMEIKKSEKSTEFDRPITTSQECLTERPTESNKSTIAYISDKTIETADCALSPKHTPVGKSASRGDAKFKQKIPKPRLTSSEILKEQQSRKNRSKEKQLKIEKLQSDERNRRKKEKGKETKDKGEQTVQCEKPEKKVKKEKKKEEDDSIFKITSKFKRECNDENKGEKECLELKLNLKVLDCEDLVDIVKESISRSTEKISSIIKQMTNNDLENPEHFICYTPEVQSSNCTEFITRNKDGSKLDCDLNIHDINIGDNDVIICDKSPEERIQSPQRQCMNQDTQNHLRQFEATTDVMPIRVQRSGDENAICVKLKWKQDNDETVEKPTCECCWKPSIADDSKCKTDTEVSIDKNKKEVKKMVKKDSSKGDEINLCCCPKPPGDEKKEKSSCCCLKDTETGKSKKENKEKIKKESLKEAKGNGKKGTVSCCVSCVCQSLKKPDDKSSQEKSKKSSKGKLKDSKTDIKKEDKGKGIKDGIQDDKEKKGKGCCCKVKSDKTYNKESIKDVKTQNSKSSCSTKQSNVSKQELQEICKKALNEKSKLYKPENENEGKKKKKTGFVRESDETIISYCSENQDKELRDDSSKNRKEKTKTGSVKSELEKQSAGCCCPQPSQEEQVSEEKSSKGSKEKTKEMRKKESTKDATENPSKGCCCPKELENEKNQGKISKESKDLQKQSAGCCCPQPSLEEQDSQEKSRKGSKGKTKEMKKKESIKDDVEKPSKPCCCPEKSENNYEEEKLTKESKEKKKGKAIEDDKINTSKGCFCPKESKKKPKKDLDKNIDVDDDEDDLDDGDLKKVVLDDDDFLDDFDDDLEDEEKSKRSIKSLIQNLKGKTKKVCSPHPKVSRELRYTMYDSKNSSNLENSFYVNKEDVLIDNSTIEDQREDSLYYSTKQEKKAQLGTSSQADDTDNINEAYNDEKCYYYKSIMEREEPKVKHSVGKNMNEIYTYTEIEQKKQEDIPKIQVKDSVEVLKKRKVYAQRKTNWYSVRDCIGDSKGLKKQIKFISIPTSPSKHNPTPIGSCEPSVSIIKKNKDDTPSSKCLSNPNILMMENEPSAFFDKKSIQSAHENEKISVENKYSKAKCLRKRAIQKEKSFSPETSSVSFKIPSIKSLKEKKSLSNSQFVDKSSKDSCTELRNTGQNEYNYQPASPVHSIVSPKERLFGDSTISPPQSCKIIPNPKESSSQSKRANKTSLRLLSDCHQFNSKENVVVSNKMIEQCKPEEIKIQESTQNHDVEIPSGSLQSGKENPSVTTNSSMRHSRISIEIISKKQSKPKTSVTLSPKYLPRNVNDLLKQPSIQEENLYLSTKLLIPEQQSQNSQKIETIKKMQRNSNASTNENSSFRQKGSRFSNLYCFSASHTSPERSCHLKCSKLEPNSSNQENFEEHQLFNKTDNELDENHDTDAQYVRVATKVSSVKQSLFSKEKESQHSKIYRLSISQTLTKKCLAKNNDTLTPSLNNSEKIKTVSEYNEYLEQPRILDEVGNGEGIPILASITKCSNEFQAKGEIANETKNLEINSLGLSEINNQENSRSKENNRKHPHSKDNVVPLISSVEQRRVLTDQGMTYQPIKSLKSLSFPMQLEEKFQALPYTSDTIVSNTKLVRKDNTVQANPYLSDTVISSLTKFLDKEKTSAVIQTLPYKSRAECFCPDPPLHKRRHLTSPEVRTYEEDDDEGGIDYVCPRGMIDDEGYCQTGLQRARKPYCPKMIDCPNSPLSKEMIVRINSREAIKMVFKKRRGRIKVGYPQNYTLKDEMGRTIAERKDYRVPGVKYDEDIEDDDDDVDQNTVVQHVAKVSSQKSKSSVKDLMRFIKKQDPKTEKIAEGKKSNKKVVEINILFDTPQAVQKMDHSNDNLKLNSTDVFVVNDLNEQVSPTKRKPKSNKNFSIRIIVNDNKKQTSVTSKIPKLEENLSSTIDIEDFSRNISANYHTISKCYSKDLKYRRAFCKVNNVQEIQNKPHEKDILTCNEYCGLTCHHKMIRKVHTGNCASKVSKSGDSNMIKNTDDYKREIEKYYDEEFDTLSETKKYNLGQTHLNKTTKDLKLNIKPNAFRSYDSLNHYNTNETLFIGKNTKGKIENPIMSESTVSSDWSYLKTTADPFENFKVLLKPNIRDESASCDFTSTDSESRVNVCTQCSNSILSDQKAYQNVVTANHLHNLPANFLPVKRIASPPRNFKNHKKVDVKHKVFVSKISHLKKRSRYRPCRCRHCLDISSEDRIVIFDRPISDLSLESRYIKEVQNLEFNMQPKRRKAKVKSSDILQSDEVKRAVLEIYATAANRSGRHFVARLPKFVYNGAKDLGVQTISAGEMT